MTENDTVVTVSHFYHRIAALENHIIPNAIDRTIVMRGAEHFLLAML
jgi:hypothetical protein